MKELIDFIKDDKCPCCGKKLSFYMKILHNDLFRMSDNQTIDNALIFAPINPIIKDVYINTSNFSVILDEHLYERIDKEHIFFFGICNEEAFNNKESFSYEIDFHDLCYYKSTKFLVLDETENGTLLKINDEQYCDGDIRHFDAFSLIKETEDQHMSYMIQIDLISKNTSLWHYKCSMEDLKDEDYNPKIFYKQINALKKNLDWSNKEKIINLLDNWIIMS